MHASKFIFFLLILTACTLKNYQVKEPIRAKDIPENAFWVGGVDGGNWYFIVSLHDHRNNATINIYNDIDGSLIVSKKFILICPAGKQMLIQDLKSQIVSFDGQKILLKSHEGKNACYLQ